MALAIEQDEKIQHDEERIQKMVELSKPYQEKFTILKKAWKENSLTLKEQHKQLQKVAKDFLSQS